MSNSQVLNWLYSKKPQDCALFNFDMLTRNPILYYLTLQDINELHKIASSIRLASKLEVKYKKIDEIMRNRGFTKFHCGTNRIVYRFYEDDSFLIKIALDKVGLRDNPDEFRNQHYLKPFITKVFDVSPCGTVALVERVKPVTSREEFVSMSGGVYDLITNCIIGKYVLDDIGSKYFMNWGFREGFGPVLLDYPYMYELDDSKLYCNKVDRMTGMMCNGVIDYDLGFNDLVCTKCGKKYLAKELETKVRNQEVLVKDKDNDNISIRILKGDKVIKTLGNNIKQSKSIIRK